MHCLMLDRRIANGSPSGFDMVTEAALDKSACGQVTSQPLAGMTSRGTRYSAVRRAGH